MQQLTREQQFSVYALNQIVWSLRDKRERIPRDQSQQ